MFRIELVKLAALTFPSLNKTKTPPGPAIKFPPKLTAPELRTPRAVMFCQMKQAAALFSSTRPAGKIS